nr:MAG TPA: hypothetical protein [Bacteriophage sp.]
MQRRKRRVTFNKGTAELPGRPGFFQGRKISFQQAAVKAACFSCFR